MTNRDLAEKIYEDLNKRGADLGNASIGIIHKTLDDNGVKNCSIPVVTHRISKLSIESKNKLFAIWMGKERLEGSKTLDLMFALDDEWDLVYEKYRITEGFSAAKLRANERILSIVYGG